MAKKDIPRLLPPEGTPAHTKHVLKGPHGALETFTWTGEVWMEQWRLRWRSSRSPAKQPWRMARDGWTYSHRYDVPCQWCGTMTENRNSAMCHNCADLQTVVEKNPDLIKRMVDELVCPLCKGKGTAIACDAIDNGKPINPRPDVCMACDGKGIVSREKEAA